VEGPFHFLVSDGLQPAAEAIEAAEGNGHIASVHTMEMGEHLHLHALYADGSRLFV
jgi:hypothetical protein